MYFDIKKLSPHLFWDTNLDNVNWKEHWRYIIIRVMERGNLDDVKLVWNSYGEDTIRDALTHARSLSNLTISYFANKFRLPKSAFRAYADTDTSAIWNS